MVVLHVFEGNVPYLSRTAKEFALGKEETGNPIAPDVMKAQSITSNSGCPIATPTCTTTGISNTAATVDEMKLAKTPTSPVKARITTYAEAPSNIFSITSPTTTNKPLLSTQTPRLSPPPSRISVSQLNELKSGVVM